MQDGPDQYDVDIDTLKYTYMLHDNADTAKLDVLHYLHPGEHLMELMGKWKGNEVHIVMKEISLDSMALNKERIIFYQE